ncbi:DUF3857 domain-containing protein [Arcticibacter sp. MXS-1]|uniref:DUF3857 domain-containing protein n=1 Tax=Arcticibacter sp. MXS-1 TaxID=3341726 RepID=UPI0035A82ED2
MIKRLVMFLLLAGISNAFSQDNYAVSAIPRNLLYRAGAVIRNSEMVMVVNAPDDVSYKERCAVTIMNSAGDDEARIVASYDKVNQIRGIRGTIYNEFGIPVSKFAERDFDDRSAVSNISLYEDDRMKVFKPAQVTYPYTIAYEIDIRMRQSLFFPKWQPVTAEGVSIEKSSLQFSCPADFAIRYKAFNYKGAVEEGSDKNLKTYKWQVANVGAMRAEPYSPNPEAYMTSVQLAPVNFAYRGIKGSFKDWAEYGKWMSESLLKGRDLLPEATRQYVHQLVDSIKDPKLKARKLYEYMQDKTRYISVQIGIGGYQPFPAAEVDRFSYGDCKGLVNYTRALLKEAGIDSYYCVVNAGGFKKDVTADFASMNDGNHAILCVPFKADTVWLECTDKKSPFGFLGYFTDDRLVLACTPQGGKILRTPKFASSDNLQVRKATFKLAENGDLSGKISTRFEGTQYDNHDELDGEPLKEQLKKIAELYPLPNLQVQTFDFRREKNGKPVTTETFDFNSRAYASANQGQMYLSLNVINKEKRVIPDMRNRSNPLYINRGYVDEDEYVFEIPAKAQADYIPRPVVIEKPFGSFSSTVLVEGKTVRYKRIVKMNEGSYPKEAYADFVRFHQEIAESDNERLVLKFQ